MGVSLNNDEVVTQSTCHLEFISCGPVYDSISHTKKVEATASHRSFSCPLDFSVQHVALDTKNSSMSL